MPEHARQPTPGVPCVWRRVLPFLILTCALAAWQGSTHAQVPQISAATQAAAQAYDGSSVIFHPVLARHGMVVTENALATRVGLNVLQRGGNAIDAAVAVGFALAVVQPYAGNLGGGGFMLAHLADGRDVALDFRETAPAQAVADRYLDEHGDVIEGQSLHTIQAVGVPGTVAGLTHALERWGSQPLDAVLVPAIRMAREGIEVSTTLADALARTARPMGHWPATRAIFWRDDHPLRAGDRLVQSDLAWSLEQIASRGADAFYRGPIAERIVAEMDRQGGWITAADLAAYQARERAPLRGQYRGYDVVAMPPPSSGGVHLLQLLNLIEAWPLADWGAGSAKTLHHMAEAMKLAYADRGKYLGDSDFVRVPVKGLISKAYAQELRARIDPLRAAPVATLRPGNPWPHESDETTHFSVIDAAGNAVSVTYTLNTHFGSGIVASGTGILLNNEMDDFALKPGVANVYGLTGGAANAVEPGKRPLSSMTPTIVLKDGEAWLVTGSPGGSRIITTVLETVVDAIDFGMNPAEAAAQPRFHDQGWPEELRVERGFSPDTLALLEQMGHRVVVRPTMGKTQTIQRRHGWLYGASDPRNPDGLALGY